MKSYVFSNETLRKSKLDLIFYLESWKNLNPDEEESKEFLN